jgi:pyruvate/2-oxoglutarate/acetoin dehydrogenase E1 component
MVEMVEAALAALRDEEEVLADLLIPTQLYPLDLEPIVESVLETGRLLVVEEGQGFAGFGGELIAQVVSRCSTVGGPSPPYAFADPSPPVGWAVPTIPSAVGRLSPPYAFAHEAGASPHFALRADRVCAAPCVIPAAKPAELEALPSTDDIVGAAVRLITST